MNPVFMSPVFKKPTFYGGGSPAFNAGLQAAAPQPQPQMPQQQPQAPAPQMPQQQPMQQMPMPAVQQPVPQPNTGGLPPGLDFKLYGKAKRNYAGVDPYTADLSGVDRGDWQQRGNKFMGSLPGGGGFKARGGPGGK